MEARPRTLELLAGAGLCALAPLAPQPWVRAALGCAGAGLVARGLGLSGWAAGLAALGFAGSGALSFGIGASGSAPDLVLLGALCVLAALLRAWRASEAATPPRLRWAGALGVLLGLAGCVLLAQARGVACERALALVPDLFHAPAAGGFRGEGRFAEWVRLFVAAPVWLFALSSAASQRGVLRARGGLQLATLASLALAPSVPVLQLPAALGLSLCAGDGLARSAPAARALAAAAFALLVLLAVASVPPERAGPRTELDWPDDWLSWSAVPASNALAWEFQARPGWFPRLEIECVRHAGEQSTLELRVPLERTAAAGVERWSHAPIALAELGRGRWSFEVPLQLSEARGLARGRRVIGALDLPREPSLTPLTLGLVLLGCAALASSARAPRRAGLVACLATLAQSLALACSAGAWPG